MRRRGQKCLALIWGKCHCKAGALSLWIGAGRHLTTKLFCQDLHHSHAKTGNAVGWVKPRWKARPLITHDELSGLRVFVWYRNLPGAMLARVRHQLIDNKA